MTTQQIAARPMSEQEIAVLNSTKDISKMSKAEALAELAVYRKYKLWGSSRYYTLDRRVQELACREWVHDDVFGNTFGPLFL